MLEAKVAGDRSFLKPVQTVSKVSKGNLGGKVPVDIFRSAALSCCYTFIFKQAGKGVIDGVCRAVLEAQRAHLTG